VKGRDAVLIAGPTASGKSALAVALARMTGGPVINADSMQVYRQLRVLTARPTEAEMGGVPHRLFGYVDASEAYSVGRWLADIANELEENSDGPPVIVGGTGLYFRALTEGLSRIQPIPNQVRDKWRALFGRQGSEPLVKALAEGDPQGEIPVDPQRLMRAIEVLEATGKPLRWWQSQADDAPVLDPKRCLRLVIAPDRAWLHARIEARFDAMVVAGGWEEAEAFAALDLDPALPAMKAIGIRELVAAARDRTPREDAVRDAKTATRRYAKRQETWFRNQMADWERIAPGADPQAVWQARACP